MTYAEGAQDAVGPHSQGPGQQVGRRAKVPGSEDEPIPQVPGYEVLRPIGAGGNGSVWAVRRADGMRLAVKVVPGLDAPEATWAGAVTDDHLMAVLDVVVGQTATQEPATCLVMPLAEGGSLAEVIAARGSLTAGELVTVLVPIARAVHRLHSLGLVHGDIKPANVLLTADGRPLLSDLGAARIAAQTGEEEVWATQLWSAPEVLGGEPAGPAADSYGLGAVAWACATGEAPPPASLRPTLTDVATQLDDRLCDAITACLSHTPSARPSPGEFGELVWAAADARPAPVALSAGARTAPPIADPGAELTRRIRSRAAEALADSGMPTGDGGDGRSGGGHRRSARGGRRRGADGGSRVQWLAPFDGSSWSWGWSSSRSSTGSSSRSSRWPSARSAGRSLRRAADPDGDATRVGRDTRARRARHAAADPVPWGRWSVLVGCLAMLLVTTGWWLLTPAPSPRSAAATQPTTTTATAGPVGTRSATMVDPQTGKTTVTTAALTQPSQLLQSLLARRARAWNSLDPGALQGAFVAGSSAWQRDSTDLATAGSRQATYQGVGFTVDLAQVRSATASSVTVRAVIHRTPCQLLVAGRITQIPAEVSTVDFDLRRTAAGWRIDAWRSGATT